MAAACSISPFIPELLNVALPRRDTWDFFNHFIPIFLWLYLCACTLLPFLLPWAYFLRYKFSLLRVRLMSLWFFILLVSIPYTSALSAGLTVKWVPLPSPRSAPPWSPSRFSQDGWGTDLGPPTAPDVSIQEKLRRQSEASVRAFVATSAYDNELVSKVSLRDRTNREAGIQNKKRK